MPHTIVLPAFAPDQPAARVDAALRAALAACDRARECAVQWFAEVQRRALYREFGHASLELYATQGPGFPPNRYWQFKRLADDLERLPVLREAVASGELGWTKAQQVARVATPATQAAWVAKAAATGRRELAREVQAARGMARGVARRTAAIEAGNEAADPRAMTGGELPFGAPIAPLAPAQVEASITLRGDALQVARYEALLEKARRLRLGAAGAGRLDLVLEALAVLARDRHRCATPGCRATRFLEVHHVVTRAQGGSNDMANLVTLCSRCHAFAHEDRAPRHETTLAPAQVEAVPGAAR